MAQWELWMLAVPSYFNMMCYLASLNCIVAKRLYCILNGYLFSIMMQPFSPVYDVCASCSFSLTLRNGYMVILQSKWCRFHARSDSLLVYSIKKRYGKEVRSDIESHFIPTCSWFFMVCSFFLFPAQSVVIANVFSFFIWAGVDMKR